jgi:hypothetical protein
MARYDADWGRYSGWGRYDRSFRTPSFGPPAGYDDSGYSNGPDFGGGIYGPERYGLGPYHERLRTRKRPDKDLREEVEEALFYDTWVDAEAVTVEVKDGIVTLRGELPDYEEVRYATDDAWDVDGVLGVRSELTAGGG